MKLDDVKPIAAGEYDLANISLIGFDPNNGRTYEECHEEFEGWRKELEGRIANRPWWRIDQWLRNNHKAAILTERLGMSL